MNRREFSKICASAAITGFAFDASLASGVDQRQAGTSKAESGVRSSGDAYIRREEMTWIIGTSKVEQRISLQNGHLLLKSFKNKISDREYRDRGSDPEQIRMKIDGAEVGSPSWNWTFVSDDSQTLSQGELQLNLRLRGGPIEVTKHLVVYPHTAIIREWLTVDNSSHQAIRMQDLFFMNTRVMGDRLDALELDYVSGGGNFNGSQLLKTERLSRGYARTFDSEAGVQTGNYSAYLPLLLLRDVSANNTLAMGWDYMGHWALHVGGHSGEQVGVAIQVAGYDGHLAPGGRVTTPKAFTAAFCGDLDDIGNQILDWQYQFFWEFTNPEYFGKTRWAVDWPSPWVGDGGTPCADNWGRRLSLDLRYTDLLRECGGDILWDDAGWYDRWGDWNGPDWQLATAYLRKHSMRWVLWQPTFLATPESQVAQNHHDWVIPGRMAFEQSIPETATWQKKLLDENVSKWQDYQWRYDIAPAASTSDTKLLAADQNFRELLEQFKTSHPQSGVDACDGGGRWISYDIARLAESGEYTDGGVGPYSGYYTSLLVPPDKLHNVSDFDHTYYNASSDRTHLALNPTWYRDPGDGEDLEAIRKDWEIYRYLIAKGVAGRWSHIFRPRVKGDDPIWYSQRMSSNGSSGIIIVKHAKIGTEYFLVSKPMSNFQGDSFEGGPWQMSQISTTSTVTLDTGIYADPIDDAYRYYGVPGEVYGPLNFRYQTQDGEKSYATQIAKHGVTNHVGTRFFGMAFQTGNEPVTISELGQFDPSNNQGTYSLMLIRAADSTVLGSVTLDMSQSPVDSSGFKYAKLANPIRLEPGLDSPITVFPNGLQLRTTYDVRTYYSGLHVQRSGASLMREGITLSRVPPGELIMLNLPDYPGSGTNRTTPAPPLDVTKRVGTNLGTQGVEVAWSAPSGNGWISYYEVLKNGSVIGKTAKGTFFFDHSPTARHEVAARYEVRSVEGDANRSALVPANEIPGDAETHDPLGEFGPSQGSNGWRYEQSFDQNVYEDLTWQNGGYEGFWTGSGLGRIGRIWAQPSAGAEIARTFVVSANGSLHISGEIQKDPSAEAAFRVSVRIEHNGRQIWPASEWASVPAFGSPTSHAIENIAVRHEDTIRFVIKRIDENKAIPIIWRPILQMNGKS